MAAATETRAFEAEVSQVLHLVTHSLYSHKEIFLRELVSNASDACDKLRFAALSEPDLLAGDPDLAVDVRVDRKARTLAITDNGIGMTREEVIDNIGTIARSGTRRFLEALSGDARKDTQLIGQFGVGFYSAFIVADVVEIVTRSARAQPDSAVRWKSTGSGEYTLEAAGNAPRGTTVTLHLREDESEFLDAARLRDLIHRYSGHVSFPIRLHAEDSAAKGEGPETVNGANAVWMRPRAEVTDAEYQAFYKSLTHDFSDALAWTHNAVEGRQNYTLLLYLPSRPPLETLLTGHEERKGLKLYIRRVLIMDASELLLPAWLRFVRGVVDADDLPLNVSRETLQDNRLVGQIRAACVKRVLDLLDRLAKDEPEKFAKFNAAFGNVLKEGIVDDPDHRERIAKLLRFASTASGSNERTVSLDDYVGRMQPGQDAIWYVTADSHPAAKGSPHIEALVGRGVEVLLLTDRIDEWMAGHLGEYGGKRLRDAAKGDSDGPVDAEQHRQRVEAAKPLVEKLKGWLGDAVSEVRVSTRLTGSPSCLVTGEHDLSLRMQRLLREAGHDVPAVAPVLEINPDHPLVQRLADETDPDYASDIGWLLFDEARVAAGDNLVDPGGFIARINRALLDGRRTG
ncbi:MAG: molecular chaperone HtpG [Lysobacterales bacterium]